MIVDWDATRERFINGSILLGNGASRTVWDPFGYPSLFQRASALEPGLSPEAVNVFDSFDTHDFEGILRQIQTTVKVLEALAVDSAQVRGLHEVIREALIAAVHSVHLPWNSFEDVASVYRAALADHDWLFSTNYDLLVYWAVMHEDGGAGFKDALWGPKGTFDRNDAEFWNNVVKVVYLHGGLHIERNAQGQARKRDTELGNLLETFGPDIDTGRTPLFVSEGSATDKIRTILQSEYLSWALESLELLSGPLVVFGSALGESDDHIVQAINRSKCNPVGVSVFTKNVIDEVTTEKALESRLPHKTVIAFDSATHPLGDDQLRIHE